MANINDTSFTLAKRARGAARWPAGTDLTKVYNNPEKGTLAVVDGVLFMFDGSVWGDYFNTQDHLNLTDASGQFALTLGSASDGLDAQREIVMYRDRRSVTGTIDRVVIYTPGLTVNNSQVGIQVAHATTLGGSFTVDSTFYISDDGTHMQSAATGPQRPSPFATQAGILSMTSSPANTRESTNVTFASGRFTATPHVFVQVESAVPGGAYGTSPDPEASPSAITTSGFVMNFLRADTTATTIHWFAVQMLSSSADG